MEIEEKTYLFLNSKLRSFNSSSFLLKSPLLMRRWESVSKPPIGRKSSAELIGRWEYGSGPGKFAGRKLSAETVGW